MKIGIMGTGSVGQALNTKLTSLGHQVLVGSRKNFAEAAAHGEIVFLCTKGEGALPAVQAAKAHLGGKILIDITNQLDQAKVMAESLGEQVQKEAPDCRVVKSLNTVNASLMVNPGQLGHGEHDIFVCGNDESAKHTVTETVLKGFFGWKHVIDLGDISKARGTEAYLSLWIRLYGTLQTANFNLHIVR